MNEMLTNTIPDERVFDTGGRRTLANVLAECEGALTGTALRDTRSAFRFLADKCGVDLAATLARPQEVRQIFAPLSPARLGISEKRFANIRSLVGSAVVRFGMRRTWITREIPLDETWRDLLARIPDRQHRWGLSRLACYCTVKGIEPAAVDSTTLLGLHAALVAESLSKDPRNLLKHTIAVWNICHRRVPGWPGSPLCSPFKCEPFMMPLEAFPAGFQQDVAAFETRMTNPDPLDPNAPLRAFRPDTLNSYLNTFRRVASALVRGGHVDLDAVAGLHTLFEGKNFAEALRPFLLKGEGRDTGYVHKMATQLIAVARHHLRLDEMRLGEIEGIARRLKPKAGGMGRRNRVRLAQFDDEAVVRRLLRFPEEERARALVKNNPLRRARGIERALAISMLLFTGMRVKNLRQLRRDRNIRRAGNRVFVFLPASETKTHAELELELPPETIALLDEFLAEHRGLLPCADGPWLFPGITGGPRSYSAMRDAVGRPLRRHAGIEISPHLFRHIIAKIIAERCPEHLHDVSRMLGHKSMRTTYSAYLGTEGPAASRRIARLLREVSGRKSGEQE
ncbi:MAG: site-specific integrase [Proteobacteria bacterium]|nr:site-specific integrase [Pseudomonadota bacterium]